MSEPLLVVIDMQDVFRDADSPWRTASFDEAADGIDRLVDAFDHVAFTRFVPPEDRRGSWGPYYETFAEVLRPDRRAWWELTARYRDRAGGGDDGIVTRATFSAWGERLRHLAGEPATLVLCGVATDCCVISTALDAADAGAFVRVVEDACGGSDGASHDAAIAVMRNYAPQVEITSVQTELARGSREPTGAR